VSIVQSQDVVSQVVAERVHTGVAIRGDWNDEGFITGTIGAVVLGHPIISVPGSMVSPVPIPSASRPPEMWSSVTA